MKLITAAAVAVIVAATAGACDSAAGSQPAPESTSTACPGINCAQPPSSAAPNAQLANAWLATGSNWVNFIQWNSSGVGSLTDDTLTGTPPDEQVSSSQTPITASVNGSEVTFTGLQQDTGTLAGGQLSLQVLQSDGSLATDTFSPATQDQFNSAASTLNNQAASDNSVALQQQAQASSASASAAASASQASANAGAEQTAQKDLATVQGINFTADTNSLNGDAATANTDLGTVKSDAANGQGQDCNNVDPVGTDVDGVVTDANEMTSDLSGGITFDISTARQDVSALQDDVTGLRNAGLPVPSGASAAISSAQSAISTVVSTANGDISQENADVSAAYQVLGTLATGACSSSGSGSPPPPIPPIS